MGGNQKIPRGRIPPSPPINKKVKITTKKEIAQKRQAWQITMGELKCRTGYLSLVNIKTVNQL